MVCSALAVSVRDASASATRADKARAGGDSIISGVTCARSILGVLFIVVLSGECLGPSPPLSLEKLTYVFNSLSSPAAFSRNNDLKRHAATHESPLYSCDVGSW